MKGDLDGDHTLFEDDDHAGRNMDQNSIKNLQILENYFKKRLICSIFIITKYGLYL